MAFPRKNTRCLRVDGIRYLWHLNHDWDVRSRWIVVQREDCVGGQLLMVNPYHHDLLPTRGAVGGAIRFALCHGWRPEQKAAPLRLIFAGKESGFQLLALESSRHWSGAFGGWREAANCMSSVCGGVNMLHCRLIIICASLPSVF